MQTPFEQLPPAAGNAAPENGDAHSGQRRSVFGNYVAPAACNSRREEAQTSFHAVTKNDLSLLTSAPTSRLGLQAAIDIALARAFLYQFLARMFEDPASDTWEWLTNANTHRVFESAIRALATAASSVDKPAAALMAQLRHNRFEPFQVAYVTAFGHAARGDCPLNEIEYGDLNADPLFQPHRLADLTAFYHAFGLEVADDAAERPDHIGMELEFMAVLAAKEAYALEHQLDTDESALCIVAQKKFLREHLAQWTPAFTRRLSRLAGEESILGALATFTRVFVAAECARYGINPGGEDLLLRPVDAATESLCASCGIHNLPPGALPLTPRVQT